MVNSEVRDRLRARVANIDRRSHYIILPMHWLTEFESEEISVLTNKVDIRDIIKSVTSVPIYLDYETALYEELQERGVFDDVENDTVGWITFFLEIFVERLYQELALIVHQDDMDHYLFHSWVDDYSLMMVRNDVPNDVSETMADRIASARTGFLSSDYVV